MSTNVKLVPLKLSDYITLLRESFRGKGTGRTLSNLQISEYYLSGTVLDLGSKSNRMSYNRFLRYDPAMKLIHTDMETDENSEVIKLDLEQPFNLADQSFDVVLCFNTLEHIYNHRNVMTEVWRILRPGGRLYLSVPFLTRYHKDPHDYWRYTYETLEFLAHEAGFQQAEVTALVVGPFTTAFSLWYGWLPGWLRPLFLAPHLALDVIMRLLRPKFISDYAESYFLVATKS